ncbi:hypothetical protein LUG20_47305 [Bradyrhizobium japonicum]|nr:hypothetical protein [Bradyrhizobium japonicum]MCD9825482.1 hypothetical protein [Bradyrhizobium japonicum]MCD9898434.1 hypothetical protein [Bradyrhizobium japonicum]MEB2671229.1 hypothetical protein [Bradyrhizobium japonicum]WRI90544.1 hypothetical protein R3F75_06350 [Bradyrhizobium japonicum]WRJ84706.1 hypothetical protein R3F78_07435 [Bradyrhizobium japonicum]
MLAEQGIHDDASPDQEDAALAERDRTVVLTYQFRTLGKVPSLSLFSAVTFHGAAKNLTGAYYFPNGPIDLSKADLS